MADRCTLHRNRIEAFATWAEREGWRRVPTKGAYEMLRLVHADFTHPFIAYDRGSPEHVSVPLTPTGSRRNQLMVLRFIRERRKEGR